MIHMVRDVDAVRLLTQGTEQVGVAVGPKANVPRHAVDPHVPRHPTTLASVHHVLDAIHITVVITEVEVPRETPILPVTVAMNFLLGDDVTLGHKTSFEQVTESVHLKAAHHVHHRITTRKRELAE